MKALIVDDDFYSRNMIHEILRPVAQCDIAVNGEEAIEAFRRGMDAGEAYDLICLDLLMPELDGQQEIGRASCRERV